MAVMLLQLWGKAVLENGGGPVGPFHWITVRHITAVTPELAREIGLLMVRAALKENEQPRLVSVDASGTEHVYLEITD